MGGLAHNSRISFKMRARAQADAMDRMQGGVMMGAVVKVAVHAKGGALREPVRMELRHALCTL